MNHEGIEVEQTGEYHGLGICFIGLRHTIQYPFTTNLLVKSDWINVASVINCATRTESHY